MTAWIVLNTPTAAGSVASGIERPGVMKRRNKQRQLERRRQHMLTQKAKRKAGEKEPPKTKRKQPRKPR